MVENILHHSIRTLKWKRSQLSKYQKIGLFKSALPVALMELIDSKLRKENYSRYRKKLRDYYEAKYGLQLAEGMNPVGMEEVLVDNIYSRYPDFIPSEEDVVLDVGAQFGDFTLLCAKIWKAKWVYTFEPLKDNFNLLVENLRLNNVGNVSTFNAAVGKEAGTITINRENNMATVCETAEKEFTEVLALDSLSLDKIDFLKIDVEGFEVSVLEGAMDSIGKNRPKVIMEVHSSELKEKVLGILSSFGYKVIHQSRPIFRADNQMDMVQNLFLSA